ncbi:MAG: P1 family peptidase, partial [Chloroflexi bacterium]|nr:P1 family peptidase [Chloroflexota bacterium]
MPTKSSTNASLTPLVAQPRKFFASVVFFGAVSLNAAGIEVRAQGKPTARELGIITGILDPGRTNGIVDVAGVLVGHSTIAGDSFNTGVTVVKPHGGNIFV